MNAPDAFRAQLVEALPRLRRVRLDGVAHMGPVTHAERVNAVIADFLSA